MTGSCQIDSTERRESSSVPRVAEFRMPWQYSMVPYFPQKRWLRELMGSSTHTAGTAELEASSVLLEVTFSSSSLQGN